MHPAAEMPRGNRGNGEVDLQYEIMLKLLFYTAIRVSELVRIETTDVDLDHCKIYLPEREVISGAGRIPVRQPRVRHRDQGRFTSAILPKYLRRVPSVDALIPALYLKGISTGDFSEALTAILGEGASGLSATNIVRLKSGWETDYKAWSQRDLSAKRYVYWWADGVYFNVRLDEERTCVLVLIGAHRRWQQRIVSGGRRLSRKHSILA
jgi:hypothetical protein